MPRSAVAEQTDFNLNAFKGKIAQVVVETVFLEFGFLVYPFGYESYFTNLIKSLSKRSAVQATKLRSMPDLVAADPEAADVHILEVKATTADPADYRMRVKQAEFYRKHWPEADLVVFSVREGDLFAAGISELPFESCEVDEFADGREAYCLSLQDDFERVPYRYDFDEDDYERIMNQMWYRLRRFSDAR